MKNKKSTISTQSTIVSQYYLNNKVSYSTIQQAWQGLLSYVAGISSMIVQEYGINAEVITVDETNKKIIINRKNHIVPLSSYVPILSPVILDPLSANIKDK